MSYTIHSTLQCKQEQLRNGYFQSGDGPVTILLLGSCRTLSYLNYLVRFNESAGRPLRVCRIDPQDFAWNIKDELVDLETAIEACEENQWILELLRTTEIFVHEWFAYYGMFNTDKTSPTNVYQFGMRPRIDICLPNWHDRMILFNEQLMFDSEMRERAKADGGHLSFATQAMMRDKGLAALDKFYDICRMSSFPEMAEHVRERWTRTRFFWTANHVSKWFTLYLFRQANDRFLHLPLDDSFWRGANEEDQFSRPCTAVTQFDVDAYGLTWGDPIEELVIP